MHTEYRFKVWPLNPSVLKTCWQHLCICWVMLSQVSMSDAAAGIPIYEIKVKAETSLGQESALVSCVVTPFSALQTYSGSGSLLSIISD